jgi:glyceraldehyde-3-phosphate dehydrogenase (NADP+)
VVNVITGKGSEIGDYLVMHPAVKCISFTGGDTGLAVSKKAAMVPLQMELGGKVSHDTLSHATLSHATLSHDT